MRNKKILLEKFETSPDLSEVKVEYKTSAKSRVRINSSADAYKVLFPLFDKDIIEFQELFYLLLLNRASDVLGWIKLSQGGTTGTVVDAKIIFILALKTNASAVIICHNHPSGNLKPSEADINLTKKISQAGRLFDINVLDHLIVTSNDHYYSFADEGAIT